MDNLSSNLQGTDFAALAAANPYAGAADLYRESSWQSFLSNWLGQRTEADAWRENMAIQENEYNAALLQKQHDEEYNDPINQVSRLRKAGLNPDLNAGSVDPGSPGAMGTDMSTPMQSSGSPLEDLSNVGNLIMSCFTTAVGLSGDLLSLGQLRESIDSQKIGNAGSIIDFAFNAVKNGLPAKADFRDNASAQNQATDLISATVSPLLPRRYRRQFRQNVNRFMSSLVVQSGEYADRSKLLSDRLDFVRKRGSSLTDDEDAVMQILNEGMIQMFDEASKLGAKNALRSEEVTSGSLDVQEKENVKQGEYLDNVDAGAAAAAENAENRLTQQNADMSKKINSSMEKIVNRLDGEAKKGNVAAELTLLVLNVLRLRSLNVSSGKKGFSLGFSK